MYDVEKRSAVLENAAGFVRQDANIYSLVTKWRHWGRDFPRTLYELECHQR